MIAFHRLLHMIAYFIFRDCITVMQSPCHNTKLLSTLFDTFSYLPFSNEFLTFLISYFEVFGKKNDSRFPY